MRPFHFRAERALDLRRQHEDEARVVLARAQNAAVMAEARLATARGAAATAGEQLVAVQSQGAPAWLIDWHRSWIVRTSREADACQRQAAAAHAVVTQATRVLHEAHKQRRVLERLREKLAAKHARAVERHDLAQMNELATMRYLIAAGERKDQP